MTLTAHIGGAGGLMQLVRQHPVAKIVLTGMLGAVAGYVTLALASTLVQEVWLHGVSYRQSTRSVLVLAGLFTPLCAFAGGLVSALVAARARWLAATLLSGLIAIETTYLYSTQRVDGPLWFEAGSAAALVVAICAAAWLCEHYAGRASKP